MMRRELLGLLSAGAGLIALPGCNAIFPKRHAFRFRMTVEVDTLQGLRTGSSVMEMSAALATFKLPDSAAVDLSFKGEAVAVDLPGGQTLFSLVVNGYQGKDFRADVIQTFDPSYPHEQALVNLFAVLGKPESIGRTGEIRPKNVPPLVRFRDIHNPKSVELIDPNDLAKSFGPGVKLKRIFLVVVNQPITTGQKSRLQNIGILPDHSLDNDFQMTDNPTLAQQLGYSDFSRGIQK